MAVGPPTFDRQVLSFGCATTISASGSQTSAPAAESSEPSVAVELDHPFGQPLGITLALSCDLECQVADSTHSSGFISAHPMQLSRDRRNQISLSAFAI